jgi:hypothetical protein
MNKFLLSAFLIIFGCSDGAKSPEGLLKMYAKDISTQNVDKDYYLKYTTGRLRESVEQMSDKDIKTLSRASQLTGVKVNILKKNCQEKKCSLTYIISYNSKTSDNVTFSTEVKKVAELEKIDGDWKIASVLNMKTHHESKKPIDITN